MTEGINFRKSPARTCRLFLLVAGSSLVVVTTLSLWSRNFYTPLDQMSSPEPEDVVISQLPSLLNSSWNPELLEGPPAESFREPLRSDLQYITSWPASGWTNDVMSLVNLLYLAMITERVPILPPFTPSHLLQEGAVGDIPFGDVFDLPRLSENIGIPILEWRDIKRRDSQNVDQIGCWNLWEAIQADQAFPRESHISEFLNLDISYTLAPSWARLAKDATSFWAVARLAFPEARKNGLATPLASPSGQLLPPDDHVACFDYTYYLNANQAWDWEADYHPSWRFVARYMHFTPVLQRLSETFLNRAFSLTENDATPPYITVHVRRADFIHICPADTYKDECFPPLSEFARSVEEVKAALLNKYGIDIQHVVMTSDEKDAGWWKEVADLGWYEIDHSRTRATYGIWYPLLIDATIQSGGLGFVGTEKSTMSMIAGRRVESWQNGITRTVAFHP